MTTISDSRPESSSSSNVQRRWTVIYSGLLVLALGIVVIFSKSNALMSPVALVVVAAIGLAALLLQIRFRRELSKVHSPLSLNAIGVLFALCALFADYFRLSPRMLDLMAFSAVVCFGISGCLIMHAVRRTLRNSRTTTAE